MALSRAEILNAQDLKRETVDVPEWSGSVIVQELTGELRDRFEQSIIVSDKSNARLDLANKRAKLVALSIVDDAGVLVFTDDDVEQLGKKSGAILDRLGNVASRLSKLGPDMLTGETENSAPSRGDGRS